jgi:hypothetical protein
MDFPPRSPWTTFPDVLILQPEPVVKQHPQYWLAKNGNWNSALSLVGDLVNPSQVQPLASFTRARLPILVSAHAWEQEGVNVIPEALADAIARILGWPREGGVVQTNFVAHTGSDGFSRLARQPTFEGSVQAGADYVLVDDFVGMGGTLANLRGYIEEGGGRVLGAVVLTGKPRSARLCLSPATLAALRRKHGADLEEWWKARFGHTFDALTESEAGYLVRTPEATTIRDRIIAAEQAGDPADVG